MKSQKQIVERYKRAITFLLSDKCMNITGTAIKTFHTVRELYWVLGGENELPIQLFPEIKILDKEKLYSVI